MRKRNDDTTRAALVTANTFSRKTNIMVIGEEELLEHSYYEQANAQDHDDAINHLIDYSCNNGQPKKVIVRREEQSNVGKFLSEK